MSDFSKDVNCSVQRETSEVGGRSESHCKDMLGREGNKEEINTNIETIRDIEIASTHSMEKTNIEDEVNIKLGKETPVVLRRIEVFVSEKEKTSSLQQYGAVKRNFLNSDSDEAAENFKKRARMETTSIMECPMEHYSVNEVVEPFANEGIGNLIGEEGSNVIISFSPNELGGATNNEMKDYTVDDGQCLIAHTKRKEFFLDKLGKDSITQEKMISNVKKEESINISLLKEESIHSIINEDKAISEESSIMENEQRQIQVAIEIHKEYSIVKNLLNETDTSSWSAIGFDEPYKLVEISSYSFEYGKIYHKFDKNIFRDIKDIKRVENPFLYVQYNLKMKQKQSMHGTVVEHIVFHGTKDCNEDAICKENFDFRKMGSSGYRYDKFGNGISFAINSDYAKDYPRRVFVPVRTMFVAKVLEVSRCDGQSGLIIPPEPADLAASESVLVKFFDNEFYPQYIVHYSG